MRRVNGPAPPLGKAPNSTGVGVTASGLSLHSVGFFCKAAGYWQAGVARLEKFPSCRLAVCSHGS